MSLWPPSVEDAGDVFGARYAPNLPVAGVAGKVRGVKGELDVDAYLSGDERAVTRYDVRSARPVSAPPLEEPVSEEPVVEEAEERDEREREKEEDLKLSGGLGLMRGMHALDVDLPLPSPPLPVPASSHLPSPRPVEIESNETNEQEGEELPEDMSALLSALRSTRASEESVQEDPFELERVLARERQNEGLKLAIPSLITPNAPLYPGPASAGATVPMGAYGPASAYDSGEDVALIERGPKTTVMGVNGPREASLSYSHPRRLPPSRSSPTRGIQLLRGGAASNRSASWCISRSLLLPQLSLP